MGLLVFSLQVLQDLNQGVMWVERLSEVSGEESISKLIQVVSRIQFLIAIGLRPPFPCWLTTRGHLYPYSHASLFKEVTCVLSLLHA